MTHRFFLGQLCLMAWQPPDGVCGSGLTDKGMLIGCDENIIENYLELVGWNIILIKFQKTTIKNNKDTEVLI